MERKVINFSDELQKNIMNNNSFLQHICNNSKKALTIDEFRSIKKNDH